MFAASFCTVPDHFTVITTAYKQRVQEEALRFLWLVALTVAGRAGVARPIARDTIADKSHIHRYRKFLY
jgi:hypothetical protein